MPLSSTLRELAASLPPIKPNPVSLIVHIAAAVFGEIFLCVTLSGSLPPFPPPPSLLTASCKTDESSWLRRCSTFANTFESAAFLAQSRLIDAQPKAGQQGGSAAILTALREEQKAAQQCVKTSRGFMKQTHGVDLTQLMRQQAGQAGAGAGMETETETETETEPETKSSPLPAETAVGGIDVLLSSLAVLSV